MKRKNACSVIETSGSVVDVEVETEERKVEGIELGVVNPFCGYQGQGKVSGCVSRPDWIPW
jgi:hypothetical protein